MEDLAHYSHRDSVTVQAPAEAVYALVADVTRIGEFSPVCRSAEWSDEDHTLFVGHNETPDLKWTTHCRVDVAEPGEEFTFTNMGMDGSTELVRWSYRFEPQGEGTLVTEHWQVLPAYRPFAARFMGDTPVESYLDGVVPTTKDGMARTLANLKAAAEA